MKDVKNYFIYTLILFIGIFLISCEEECKKPDLEKFHNKRIGFVKPDTTKVIPFRLMIDVSGGLPAIYKSRKDELTITVKNKISLFARDKILIQYLAETTSKEKETKTDRFDLLFNDDEINKQRKLLNSEKSTLDESALEPILKEKGKLTILVSDMNYSINGLDIINDSWATNSFRKWFETGGSINIEEIKDKTNPKHTIYITTFIPYNAGENIKMEYKNRIGIREILGLNSNSTSITESSEDIFSSIDPNNNFLCVNVANLGLLSNKSSSKETESILNLSIRLLSKFETSDLINIQSLINIQKIDSINTLKTYKESKSDFTDKKLFDIEIKSNNALFRVKPDIIDFPSDDCEVIVVDYYYYDESKISNNQKLFTYVNASLNDSMKGGLAATLKKIKDENKPLFSVYFVKK